MMNLAKMEKEKTSIYILIKDWFDWCKHNRDKNNPTLSALYFWIIEKCNSLGWVNSFGLLTDEAMHILGIGSYNTYKKNLLLLQEIGFINIIEFSKNQYTSNVTDNRTSETHTASGLRKPTLEEVQLTRIEPYILLWLPFNICCY